jgi:hypothetical protein
MNKGGVNLYTKLIAEYAEVPLERALEIQRFIDEQLELDWSEASSRQIEVTIRIAEKLMES